MRETNMDGSLHIEGDCCQYLRCNRPGCEGVRHLQGIYGGIMEACEKCSNVWEPEGTYCRDCEYSKVQCAERNCAWKM